MTANPLPPWFSGICLQGGLANQYELDPGVEGEERDSDAGTPQLLTLDGLAPITIFVGANNSGKSRLMRELFRQENYYRFKLSACGSGSDSDDVSKTVNNILQHMSRGSASLPEGGWILSNATNARDEPCIGVVNGNLNTIREEAMRSGSPGRRQILLDLEEELHRLGLNSGIREHKLIRRCYIPMLRGMRPPVVPDDRITGKAAEGVTDLFEKRTRHDYFRSDTQADPCSWDSDKTIARVFTGLSLYSDLRRLLLGRTQQLRDTVREYQAYLSEKFFGDRPVVLIPVEEDGNDVVHIKIGEDNEYPIYQLGDGLQSLIISTYPIFTEAEPGSLFFLEEPDIGMHPSLQRSLLEVLKERHGAKGHQFFLTTHSNHLLDLLEDNELVSIFTFSENEVPGWPSSPQASEITSGDKPAKPRLRIRRTMNKDRDVLMQLGVRPSATYLANATIWVEGISDYAYLRAYMEAFRYYLESRGGDWGKPLAARLKQYKEDRHYAFVEYNGTNLTHFDFSENSSTETQQDESQSQEKSIHSSSLCARAIVIADGDIRARVQRYNLFSNQLPGRFIVLPGKEIENLIPLDLLKDQIKYDHTSPRHGEIDQSAYISIHYSCYAHLQEGMGKFIGNEIGIKKYQGMPSGTLPPLCKSRWRSDSEGIPFRVRKAIQDSRSARQEVMESEDTIPPLPKYITQDIIWLCVVVFAHIAKANHDEKAAAELQRFKEWIISFSTNSGPTETATDAPEIRLSADEAASSPHHPPEWPIKLPSNPPADEESGHSSIPSYRECLLSQFLKNPRSPEA